MTRNDRAKDTARDRPEVNPNPAVVQLLTERLAAWGARARDPYYRTAAVDPRADPKNRNGSWTP